MGKYVMTMLNIMVGEYSESELIKLRDITLALYVADPKNDIDQERCDNLKVLIAAALDV